ncbi:hypothetical protein IMY05_C4833000500 [Salix suchowensis]|nr:hypothetical protein IMY05_C4833000500 [Salix suchowensis]
MHVNVTYNLPLVTVPLSLARKTSNAIYAQIRVNRSKPLQSISNVKVVPGFRGKRLPTDDVSKDSGLWDLNKPGMSNPRCPCTSSSTASASSVACHHVPQPNFPDACPTIRTPWSWLRLVCEHENNAYRIGCKGIDERDSASAVPMRRENQYCEVGSSSSRYGAEFGSPRLLPFASCPGTALCLLDQSFNISKEEPKDGYPGVVYSLVSQHYSTPSFDSRVTGIVASLMERHCEIYSSPKRPIGRPCLRASCARSQHGANVRQVTRTQIGSTKRQDCQDDAE